MGSEAINFSKNIQSTYALNLASKNEAVIDIFGVIGVWWDGKDSRQFIDEIKALDVDEITINISSPGGFVSDGLAIYDAIRGHKAKVTARLSGLVASMATVIACAADVVEASDTVLYMIHNIQGGAMGTPDEIRKSADIFEKQEGILVNIYRKKTGNTRAVIQKWMDAETWFTVDEAIAGGFIDSKVDGIAFDYEASADDSDTREFMLASLNCANLPALHEKKENSKTDNNTMNSLTNEDKSFFEKLFPRNKQDNKVEEATNQVAELEALQNQVQELTSQLAEANKVTEATNYAALIDGLANALNPKLEEAAKTAAIEATADLKNEVVAVTETLAATNAASEATNKRIDELATGVNKVKSLKPQPETKEDNGEGLAETVTPTEPVSTFQAFVSSKNASN